MTPDERERMLALCRQIEHEQDPSRFNKLVEELNALLEGATGNKLVANEVRFGAQKKQSMEGMKGMEDMDQKVRFRLK